VCRLGRVADGDAAVTVISGGVEVAAVDVGGATHATCAFIGARTTGVLSRHVGRGPIGFIEQAFGRWEARVRVMESTPGRSPGWPKSKPRSPNNVRSSPRKCGPRHDRVGTRGSRSCAQLIYCCYLLVEIVTQWILSGTGCTCEIADAQLFGRAGHSFDGFRKIGRSCRFRVEAVS
jgi:hypothetical protein